MLVPNKSEPLKDKHGLITKAVLINTVHGNNFLKLSTRIKQRVFLQV